MRVEAARVVADARSVDSSRAPLIQLDGGTIAGDIDLRDICGSAGAPAGAVLLDNCVLEGRLNLRGARLQRLVLRNVILNDVLLDDAEITGTVELRDVGYADGASARLSARNLRVDGALILERVRMTIGVPRSAAEIGAKPIRCALDLRGAEIFDSLRIIQCRLEGGVSLVSAKIAGETWFHDSVVTGGEGPAAIRMQGGHFSGYVGFRRTSPCEDPDVIWTEDMEGGISVLGGTFEGGLQLSGLVGRRHPAKPGTVSSSASPLLLVYHARIERMFWLGGEHCSGGVALIESRVRGRVMIGSRDQPVDFEGLLALNNNRFDGMLEISVCHDRGSGKPADGEASDPTAVAASHDGAGQPRSPSRIDLSHSRLDGPAEIRLGSESARFVADQLDMSSFDCSSLLSIEGGLLEDLALTGARFGGNVSLGSARDPLVVKRRLSLVDAVCRGQVDIQLGAYDGSAMSGDIVASRLAVEGDLQLAGDVRGSIDLSGAVVGDLVLGGGDRRKSLTFKGGAGRLRGLNLKDARVIRSLGVRGVANETTSDDAGNVSLQNFRYRFLRAPLPFYQGWSLYRMVMIWPKASRATCLNALGSDTGEIHVLDGTSDPIHSLNSRQGLVLSDEATASRYLSFFADNIWASGGSFRIVEGPEDIDPLSVGGVWGALASCFPERAAPWFGRLAGRRLWAKGRTALAALKSARREHGDFAFSRLVDHNGTIFAASFTVRPNGYVAMNQDEPVASLRPDRAVHFKPPVRELPPGPEEEAGRTSWSGSGFWEGASGEQPVCAALLALVNADALRYADAATQAAARTTIDVDLAGLSMDSLDDRHGQTWNNLEPFRLRMDGFRLNRVVAPSENPSGGSDLQSSERTAGKNFSFSWGEDWRTLDLPTRGRLQWLNHQFVDTRSETSAKTLPPKPHEFTPEPYEIFTRVVRQQGYFEMARRIDSFGRTLHYRMSATWDHNESPRNSLARLVHSALPYLLWIGFDYFTSMRRALTLCLGLWILGVAATMIGTRTDMLVLDAPPVASVVTQKGSRVAFGAPLTRDGAAGEVACGSSISPLVYPLDLMIPLVDLGEESRCSVRSEADGLPARVGVSVLSLLLALYAVAGWLAVSGAVLTATNTLRRNLI